METLNIKSLTLEPKPRKKWENLLFSSTTGWTSSMLVQKGLDEDQISDGG